MGIIIFLLHDVPAIHAFSRSTSVEPRAQETGATAKMKALQIEWLMMSEPSRPSLR